LPLKDLDSLLDELSKGGVEAAHIGSVEPHRGPEIIVD